MLQNRIDLTKNFRFENKYVIDFRNRIIIDKHVSSLLVLDRNVETYKEYLVRSLYFDDYQNTSYFDVVQGIIDRTKYRIRMYNLDKEKIYLEEKNKYIDRVYKFRTRITYREYLAIINNDTKFLLKKDDMCRRFYLAYNTRGLKPKMVIEYIRKPMVYTNSDVRITFDREIKSFSFSNNFFSKNVSKTRLFHSNDVILEVKYGEYIPGVLTQMFRNFELQRTTFSKYALSFEQLFRRKVTRWSV